MSSKFLDKTGLDTLWAKIKSTFQTLGNLVTTSTGWGSTPSDTKYPSEKLVKTSLDAKANDSAVVHKAGEENITGNKVFKNGVEFFSTSGSSGYGIFVLPDTGYGTAYSNWDSSLKDGAHFREWTLHFPSGVNFWGRIRITFIGGYNNYNASGSISKTILCAFTGSYVFNNTGSYDALGINTENEFRISDLIWDNTNGYWTIKIHSIKPTSNNNVQALCIEFGCRSNYVSVARQITWSSTAPSIVTDTSYYTKRSGNAATEPTSGGVSFNWADKPVFQSPYGYEIFNRSHTIPIGNGGTGATSAIGAEYNILNQVADIDTTINGDRKIALCNQTKSASNGVFRWLKLSNVWTWIKGLLSSESGVNISGNAATATTAAGYTSDGAIATALRGKVDKETGMGLSTNDFTTDEKNKLAGIASGAEPNVQSDWNQATTTADDYIKNKPQNLVQDASYVHTDNNYTTEDKNKVASAVQPGDLGTAASKDVPASGDASATQVVMGSDSRLTRSVWSGGGTAVCGYKICTTARIAMKSGQASNIYAIVMGSMCLTNKYASQPQGSESSGVDGALAMGSFMIWCEGKPDGTITARARLFSSDAAFNNADIAICKKYVNGAVEWFVAFGPWNSSKAVTASRSFGMSVCFDYVQNASIPDTLEAVPSGYGYEDYYSLWKHPYLQSTQQGAGSTTRPVYITANGEVKECKKLVQAVTSIDTSNMDPDVLYVM